MTSSENGGASIGTIRKAVSVLRFFADNGTEWRVRQLAAALDMPKTTTHRICQALVAEGVLEYDSPTERYRWGLSMTHIAGQICQKSDVRKLALLIMQDIVRQCNETALLALYDRSRREVTFVDEVECSRPIRYHNAIGIPFPIHAGASGKVIMAFLPQSEIEQIIGEGLAPLTESTITDPVKMRQRLAAIRAQGYDVSHGEKTLDAVGIGSPVLDDAGSVIGDLLVTVPEYRFSDAVAATVLPPLLEGAERLSRLLGYPSSAAYPPADRGQ